MSSEFFLPFMLISFFAAISPPGKRDSSADSVAQPPRANQLSALLHEMRRPTTAEVNLPVDANQKREVWQPLPCAQQSHSLINKVALSESLLRVRTSGLAPAHPGKLPNPPVLLSRTHARKPNNIHRHGTISSVCSIVISSRGVAVV